MTSFSHSSLMDAFQTLSTQYIIITIVVVVLTIIIDFKKNSKTLETEYKTIVCACVCQLLRSPLPPRRLWPARFLYHSSGAAIPADETDDTWPLFLKRMTPIEHCFEGTSSASSSTASSGTGGASSSSSSSSASQANTTGTLSEPNVQGEPSPPPPQRNGRRSLFTHINGMLSGYQPEYEDMMIVMPSDQLPQGITGSPFPHDNDLRIVKLQVVVVFVFCVCVFFPQCLLSCSFLFFFNV
jgi:hypothetical protein